MSDKRLYTKDGLPMNWNGKFWYTYKDMMTMVFQEMDDEMNHWNVACGRIDPSYLTTEQGKATLAKMQRKIRRAIMMSLSPDLAELYRTEATGSDMWTALCKRYENRSSTVAVFHAVQRLEEELRQMTYNSNDGLEVHLRKIRNKALELADYQHPVPFSTLMMYTLQSRPSQISEFAMVQAQNRYGNMPAKNQEELEEQIRAASWGYSSRKKASSQQRSTNGAGGNEKKAAVKQEKEKPSQGGPWVETRECHNCGKVGHLARNCKDPAKEAKDTKATKPTANFAVRVTSHGMVSDDEDSATTGEERSEVESPIFLSASSSSANECERPGRSRPDGSLE